MNPGEPILKVDPSLAPGAKVREQSAHTGMKSRLWKYVYVDGVETEKTILHTDTYNASKAVYRVGPEVPAAAPEKQRQRAPIPGVPQEQYLAQHQVARHQQKPYQAAQCRQRPYRVAQHHQRPHQGEPGW